MKKFFLAMACLTLLATPAFAGDTDLEFATDFTNNEFKSFVAQAGTLMAYRAIAPAEPLGITGFDVGIESSFVKIDDDDWQRALDAGNADVPSYIPVPRLHVRKGLPFGIDVGASMTQIPDSNMAIIGAELQYALLDGGITMPAVSVRGGYSMLIGVDDLDLHVYTADALVSKGFLMFTPYAGAGFMRAEGSYAGDNIFLKPFLEDQTFDQVRYFAGVQTSIALLNLTLEAELNDEMPVYSAKVSFGW